MVLDNIEITKKREKLQLLRYNEEINKNEDIAVRTLFTLAGSGIDSEVQESLKYPQQNETCQPHQGYASLGIVEYVPKRLYIDTGDIVLFPPQFKKYIQVKAASRELSFFIKVSKHQDVLTALFSPLVYVAMIISDWITRQPYQSFMLVGGNVLASVCCRIMSSYGIHVDICRKTADIEPNLYIGARNVSTYKKYVCIPSYSNETSRLWIIFDKQYFLQHEYIAVENIVRLESIIEETGIFLNRDSIMEIISLLNKNELRLDDLVAQHTHPEYCDMLYQNIQKGLLSGKAFVYDW